MNTFQKRTAIRIAAVSVILALIASPVSWFVARERSEESIVSLAIDESSGLIDHHNAAILTGPDAVRNATVAANTISGGLFDIAEIYDSSGRKLAEAMTPDGAAVESSLPHHRTPNYTAASYDSFELSGKRWVLRIFVPLRSSSTDTSGPITGYFEGVRVVPKWEEEQIFTSSLNV